MINIDDWMIANEEKSIKELNNIIKGKKVTYIDDVTDETIEFTALEIDEDDIFVYGTTDNNNERIEGYPPEYCYF